MIVWLRRESFRDEGLFRTFSRPNQDAGHGGDDPGKVGINKALEKDINLIIALRLKKLLEKNEITVIMTRDSDIGLYQSGDSNKKAADLKKRVAIIEESNADLAVSIHQNSYTEEYVKGAQVFYYTSSEQGKVFADLMQEQIKSSLGDGNHRMAKGDSSYYMLKKTSCPLIIIECGFLSNSAEAALLITEEYQEKMVQAISLGITQYLKGISDR